MIDLGGRGLATAAYGLLKPGIMLFDCEPGTRSVTLQPGRYRVAVVGAGSGGREQTGSGEYRFGGNGGGYSEKEITVTTETPYTYTVGVGGKAGTKTIEPQPGGTTSFGALLSATGGEISTLTIQGNGGVGFGGDINTQGGKGGTGTIYGAGGGAAGHRFGNGQGTPPHSSTSRQGAGFSTSGSTYRRGRSLVDGWGLGLLPNWNNYGCGATSEGGYARPVPAGMGGGGCAALEEAFHGGLGGGSASNDDAYGGDGVVIVEKLA